eukprot:GGOE01019590.1.p1 GENE.GGOE01019590.1~~GGOE01019590.1.p1  ORF type:complete len:401 (-),score=114.41 GGOE01019590.1:210-1412(-)
MAMLNVDPEKQADAFYRYKMPRILTKVEGNGNGIKTVVCNIIEISQRLGRNVEYPMRFFAHELAATSKLKDDKWILTGLHTQENIQSCIFDFIKRFVLCKACRNPETVIRVDGKKNIFLDCKACSRTTDIAPTEKLCNVIIKNEKPVIDSAPAGGKEKKEKKSKKEKDGDKKEKRSRDEEEEDKFNKATRAILDGDAILSEEIERPNPVLLLKEFVNVQPAPSLDAFVSKVLDIKEEYGFTEDKHVVSLVFEALFDKDIAKQFPTRHKMMARFVKADVEKDLISNLLLLCNEEESLKSKFHILLKKFFDVDLISGDSVEAWYERPKAPKGLSKDDFAYFKEKVAPFIEWLQQSDDDDDDDDDDDSSEGAGEKSPLPAVSPAAPKQGAEEEDEDDIDIDAI